LESTTLRAVVDLASVDTGNADRDEHLRGSDFFDATRHPEMVFRSTAIEARGDGRYAVRGELTLNGVTRTEVLDVTFHGVENFPGDGSVHAGFEATARIDRRAYGVDFNVPLGAGGFVISDSIGIELDVQLLAPAA
jgi:polyisoprenoid-binding protein YceI